MSVSTFDEVTKTTFGGSLPADDMQFVQQRELSTREIARIFGVPVWMAGVRLI